MLKGGVRSGAVRSLLAHSLSILDDVGSVSSTMAVRAQNSERTTGAKVVGRPFEKSSSGNPGGRPKGFVRVIREETRDGEELVTFMLRIFRGEFPRVKLRDRIDAATWLTDRGFGRPIQATAHALTDGEALIPLAVVQAVVADADQNGSD